MNNGWWTIGAHKTEPEPAKADDDDGIEGHEIVENDGETTRLWRFRVRADVNPGEKVAVSGNCLALGNWKHDQVFFLNRESCGNVWSNSTRIPLNAQIEYRYVVMIVVEPDGHKVTQKHHVVRKWETNKNPRLIPEGELLSKRLKLAGKTSMQALEPDTLGYYNNKELISRGWLTTETAIQLKLFNNNLQIWKSKLKNHRIFVKVTPISLTRSSVSQDVSLAADDGLSLETMDISDKIEGWPVVEVGVLNQREKHFKLQDQFGKEFVNGEFMVFQVLLPSPDCMAMMMDFYSYPPQADSQPDEPPYHVGFSYFLPNAMKNSEGQVVVPITSTRHRPIGEVHVEYLMIKPTPHYTCDLSFSLHREWKENWHGLDVGHRGAGTSFRGEHKQAKSKDMSLLPEFEENKRHKLCAEVRENTIASLKSAAGHGADFVEFDVQLSRDLVPVLYHDFYVAIAMKRKKQLVAEETIQLPVKDLSLEQLQRLKLFHINEQVTSSKFSDEHLEEHQPFPTLQQALEIVDKSVGFNIEIKWTMQLKDGTYELYHPFDLNLYLDTVLEVVLNHAQGRNIVFSCFHPDICAMIRLKQNRYPVMFLTQGITDKYPAYHDPRCQNVPIAVLFAVNMDILGINVHTEDLLRDSSQVELVKRAGLVLFCWGDDNNDVDTIKLLKDMGIHAVIYDSIDKLGTKEVKESIFSLEAKGHECMLIRAAAERADKDEYLHPTTPQSLEAPSLSGSHEAGEPNWAPSPLSFPPPTDVWPSAGKSENGQTPNMAMEEGSLFKNLLNNPT
ncbi:Glycerophosphoryl diester phosphodiesterase family [Nesidiocoris tenuis]|uniref:Glycerophosphoryl diester phosphodiesterase family n=1 Tax=Nesidiocoris tenuis TaxID=355587 RepID=A0ABN7AAV2_9HEMI|nr:Glycerophosphoryl diester phosphodiesterase family [Nesidiocoris tenuis]